MSHSVPQPSAVPGPLRTRTLNDPSVGYSSWRVRCLHQKRLSFVATLTFRRQLKKRQQWHYELGDSFWPCDITEAPHPPPLCRAQLRNAQTAQGHTAHGFHPVLYHIGVCLVAGLSPPTDPQVSRGRVRPESRGHSAGTPPGRCYFPLPQAWAAPVRLPSTVAEAEADRRKRARSPCPTCPPRGCLRCPGRWGPAAGALPCPSCRREKPGQLSSSSGHCKLTACPACLYPPENSSWPLLCCRGSPHSGAVSGGRAGGSYWLGRHGSHNSRPVHVQPLV